MGNLIKYMRFSVSKISPEISEAEAKHILLEKLQSFLEERIVFAAENIAKYVISTIRDGDVILTFGSSPLVRKVLLLAAKTKSFRLVVVDSRPLNEGLATLTALSHKVHCVVSEWLSVRTSLLPPNALCRQMQHINHHLTVYCPINHHLTLQYSPLSGAAAAMQSQHVTRVLLGASSLLSNGAMLGPAGSFVLCMDVCVWTYASGCVHGALCVGVLFIYILGIHAWHSGCVYWVLAPPLVISTCTRTD